MQIELRRDVLLQRWQVIGELATFEKRPELQLLFSKAQERGRLGLEVIEAVLPGLGPGGARGLEDHLRRLELIDDSGALTSQGRDAAESGLVPIPESGLYELVLGTDPIFGTRIFNVVRLEAQAAGGPAPTAQPLYGLPTDVRFPSWEDDQTWMLRRLVAPRGEAAKAHLIDNRRIQLVLHIDPHRADHSDWQLSERFRSNTGEHDVPERPEQGPKLDAWSLFESWFQVAAKFGRWDPETRTLRVEFDPEKLDQDARTRFHMTLTLVNVDVPSLDRFAACTVTGMPIAPLDGAEAQKWAIWMLLDAVRAEATAYVSRSDLLHRLYDLIIDTPLEEFEPVLPSHEDLVREASKDKDQALAWRLRAAVDLHPSAEPTEWLSRVSLKQPPPVNEGTNAVLLTIAPKERRSMAWLVRALSVAGAKKCVIYDKHIDHRTLPVLRALVEALRADSADLHIGIVTRVANDPAGNALGKELRQLVGSEPLDIRKLSTGPELHGRYILYGEGRSPSTIHATHSLVHARPEPGVSIDTIDLKTPLIWNDVNFTLQSKTPDQLRTAWEKLS